MTGTTIPNAQTIRWWATQEGPHYVAEAHRYDAMLTEFGDALLEAARLQPGDRVIDIGCGTGAMTLAAAQRVHPGGATMGVDVSPPMLDVARRRARDAGLTNLELIEADAQSHAFPQAHFDVVVSRNGLMFFDDPETAFANLARALRPGGRIAFVAPQGPDHSEWVMAAGTAAAAHIGIPAGLEPNTPGPYGLADPDRTMRILEGAGFTDIHVDSLSLPMWIGTDAEDALRFLSSLPRVSELFEAASPDARRAAVDAARQALTPFAGPDGVVTHDNGEWLVVATRSPEI